MSSMRLVECVPNFSEGRDSAVIEQLAACIRGSEGVRLLDVDAGAATNRTVVTFVGSPECVVDAAVKVATLASQIIDMSKHSGAHPRFGATDVCPLVPVAGVTMEEVVSYAHELGRRLGEAGISGYFYEAAATCPERKNLATVRQGEYEGLERRLQDDKWKPDFGPATFNPRSGATAVGARDFLVAYNVNLNTTSTRRANAVAFDVRERGRVMREGGSLTGKALVDEDGKTRWQPGKLKCVKGIGWYIEEYGICQVSLNLTDVSVTSMHEAFDAVVESAQSRGLRVTGSEIVGVLPLKAMLDAGRHYLTKQERSLGVSDKELIKIAVKSLGLDELAPFEADKKIIEYMLGPECSPPSRLVSMPVKDFVWETASESPAPGGGSVAALLGSLSGALGAMVANLSAHKRGWDHRWEEFSQWAEKGKAAHDELLGLVDADTVAFEKIMEAFGLPKASDEQKAARSAAIEAATVHAIEVPLKTMRASLEAMKVVKAVAEDGLAASISDAGVGAVCGRSAVIGGLLNVQVNAKQLANKDNAAKFVAEAQTLRDEADQLETDILATVQKRI